MRFDLLLLSDLKKDDRVATACFDGVKIEQTLRSDYRVLTVKWVGNN